MTRVQEKEAAQIESISRRAVVPCPAQRDNSLQLADEEFVAADREVPPSRRLSDLALVQQFKTFGVGSKKIQGAFAIKREDAVLPPDHAQILAEAATATPTGLPRRQLDTLYPPVA